MAPDALTQPKAVFLSYASEDADAATRIADALKAAGIEVWLDKSELKGGDAWDRQIRKQIHDCALFIPIISSHSQARLEGYFRREWKLAADRTADMADEKAFLVPVVIDDTSERFASVPDRFREVHWTRLPLGNTSAGFIERVSRLLSSDQASEQPHGTAVVRGALSKSQDLVWKGGPSRRWRPHLRLIIAAVAMAVGYMAADKFWLSKHVMSSAANTTVSAQPQPAAVPEKSIAVLPFADLSEKHDQEYFSDGLSEELIDALTRIPDLYVPARTSSFYFKGKAATVADIAKALAVSHILEGSVRKSGDQLRVTAQLIRADNGYHLWSQTYDRRLTDIFKVQDDITFAVVRALKASLLETQLPTAPTQNGKAYEMYLQGRVIAANANDLEDYSRAIASMQRALELDPGFAPAWSALASYRAYTYEYFTAGALDKVLAESRDAVNRALELNPKLTAAHVSKAQVLYDLEWNWLGAQDAIRRALELDPRNAEALIWASAIARVQRHFDNAAEFAQRAVEADPLNPWSHGVMGLAYLASGRVQEAEVAWRRAVELAPRMSQMHMFLGWTLITENKPVLALEQMEQETDDRYREVARALALQALAREKDADAALSVAQSRFPDIVSYPIAQVYAARGESDRAFVWLEKAYRRHDGWVPWLPWDPFLVNLRGDPRYRAYLQNLRVSE